MIILQFVHAPVVITACFIRNPEYSDLYNNAHTLLLLIVFYVRSYSMLDYKKLL